MGKITVLDQNTINQIAAGEVVERPASVVKELIENAIDAKATAITCEIKEGGIGFIRITDNGAGIEKDEIPVAFLRHSTSKIKSVEDLLTIGSLGFRGEALSSIASVAQVELVTKTRNSFIGARYIIEGGQEEKLSEIGCPDGTTFIIRNLFFNTPARRKFLKSPTTEAGYISDLMERLAISHPEISFKFINNNKTVLHTFGNSQLKDIIYHVYGRTVASALVEVTNQEKELTLQGFVGKPTISRGNRNYENYFINGRYIKSPIISKAIEEAYRPFSMQHKYPFTALHFSVPTERIDVNVHPTKMEIRFTDADEVYQMTYQTIKRALHESNMIPDVLLSSQKKDEREVLSNIPEPFEQKRLAPAMKPLPEGDFGLKDSSLSKGSFAQRGGKTPVSIPSYAIGKPSFLEGAIPSLSKQESQEMTKDTELSKLKEAIKQSNDLLHANTSNDSMQSEIKEASVYDTLVTGNKGEKLPNEDNDANKPQNMIPHVGYEHAIENPDGLENKDGLTINSKQPFKEITDVVQESFITKEESRKIFQIIGQVFLTYWLVECDQQLYIIDQHAAHEKILYEATMKQLKEKKACDAQMISPPMILSLTMKEEEAVKQHMDSLKMLGFEIEPFGGKEYAVSSVPADMYGLCGENLFIDFIDELVLDVPKGTPDVILEKIASMSCKAAVKGNQKMSPPEARALIKQLLELENPFHCPHGRPIIVSMTKYELEKKFKRVL